MRPNVVLWSVPWKVGRLGTAFQTAFVAVAFVLVLGLAGCAGFVSSTSNPPPPPALVISTSSLPNGLANTAWSVTLAASGGTAPYTWSGSSLPSWLSLNASTGQLSGTPAAAGTVSFTIQVKDSSSTPKTASKSFSFTIASGTTPVSITTSFLPNGTVGAAWSATLAANGGTAPYTWTVASGSSLPSWLNLNAATGQLSGTPTAAGAVSFTIQVTDSSSTPQTASKSFSFTIAAGTTPVSIITSSLPNGTVGTAWSATLAASGGTTPYTWTVASGSSLPSWLNLNATSGQLSGTPTAAGAVSFTMQVTDSSSTPQTASKSFSFTIASGTSPVSITTSSLPNGTVGSAWSATLAASGGTTPYTWSVASGSSLPSWLSLNASTGQLSGTPTAATTVSFTIQVRDSSSTPQTASKSFSFTIAAGITSVSVTTSSLPNGQVGSAWSATLAASGGTTPYTWSVASGSSLPSWLNLNAASGQLSGTPTAASTVSFTMQVTDSSSTPQTASKPFSFTVAAGATPVSITTSSLPNGTVGAAWSAMLAASGGKAPYSWSVASGSSLPSWLSLNAFTGQLSGTPTAAATVSFTIQATDSSSTPQTATKSFSLTVVTTTLSVSTTTLSNGQVNIPYSATLGATGGTAPYHWSILTGSLPSGLSLNSSAGQISGTPSQSGSFPIQVQVTDSSSPTNQKANQALTLVVGPAVAGTPVTSCGTLGNSGTTYVLQNDISSSGTCIVLGASGITFDLNGHTITYDTGGSSSAYGITTSSINTIHNSHITSSNGQGSIQMSNAACYVNIQTGPGQGKCATAHPVYLQTAEVDHLNITYYGEDSHGIYIYYGSLANIHDNNLYPYHTKATLNHYTVEGEIDVFIVSGVISVINNYIGGPNGTTGFGSEVSIYLGTPNPTQTAAVKNNTVHMAAAVHDAYAIEMGCSAPVSGPTPFEFSGNNITQVSGRGILVDQWGSGSPGCNQGTIHDNTLDIKEAGTADGGHGIAIAIQVRGSGQNIDIYNNTITLNVGTGMCPAQFFTDTGNDCAGIGIKLNYESIQGQNLTVHNNTITAITNDTTLNYGATGLYGVWTDNGTSSFYNNNISSNSMPVSVTPNASSAGFDGCGIGWIFRGNSITKLPNPIGYATYSFANGCVSGVTGTDSTLNQVIQDDTYSGGAGPDDIGEGGPGGGGTGSINYSYHLKWSYNVTVQDGSGKPLSGVTLTAVATGGGAETVSQVTDSSGNAQLVLTDHYVSGTALSSPVTVDFTPHIVTVVATGCKVSTSPFQLTMHQTTSQTLVCQ